MIFWGGHLHGADNIWLHFWEIPGPLDPPSHRPPENIRSLPPIRGPRDQSKQIGLEKPCRSPQRTPRNLNSGAKIGLATFSATSVGFWPQKCEPQRGGGFEPTAARNQEPRPRPFGPAGSFSWEIGPQGNHPPGGSPPGESSPWGIVPPGYAHNPRDPDNPNSHLKWL